MIPPFRLLVTGSRSITVAQKEFVWRTLNRIRMGGLVVVVHGSCSGVEKAAKRWAEVVVVVHGSCSGVDLAAKQWARMTPGVEAEDHPADWERYGKSAGMRRNAVMVELGADLCVAFPQRGSRGTWDCVRKAADAGIECRVYPLPEVDRRRPPGLEVPTGSNPGADADQP